MTADSTLAIQEAARAALIADATVISLAGGRVYDAASVPQNLWESNTDFPAYITVGEADGTQWDTKGSKSNCDGMEGAFTIETWTSKNGLVITKQLMAAIVSVVEALSSGSLTGHVLVWIRLEQSSVRPENPDGLIGHGVQRFKFLTEAS